MHLLLQSHDVLLQVGSAGGGHDLAAHVFGDLDANLRSLEGQLTSWHDDQGLDLVLGDVDALQDWDDVGSRLTSSVLGSGQDIATGQSDWDARLLDWRWSFPALLEDAHEKLALQAVVLELVSLGGGDVRGLDSLVLDGQVQFGFPSSLILLWPICEK